MNNINKSTFQWINEYNNIFILIIFNENKNVLYIIIIFINIIGSNNKWTKFK